MSDKRAAAFKNRGEAAPEALRARRQQDAVLLRKEARERVLSAKRLRVVDGDAAAQGDVYLTEEQIVALEAGLGSSSQETVLGSLQQLHRSLTDTSEAVERFVIEGSCMAHLQRLLTSSSELCQKALVTAPILIAMLGGADPFVCQEVCFSLGNLAADGELCADTLVANGILHPLLSLLSPSHANNPRLVQAALFVIWCLVRQPKHIEALFSDANFAPNLMAHLNSLHAPVAGEAAYVCVRLAADTISSRRLYNAGIAGLLAARLKELLENTALRDAAAVPLVRFLGHVTGGIDCEVWTDALIGGKVFPQPAFSMTNDKFLKLLRGAISLRETTLAKLLWSGLRDVAGQHALLKETLWAVSNLVAGTDSQASLMVEGGILLPLCAAIAVQDAAVRVEAGYAVLNIAVRGKEFMDQAVHAGAVERFTDMLSMTYSEEAVMLALAFVDSFCRLCPQAFEKLPATQITQSIDNVLLSCTGNERVSEAASLILDQHFGSL